jgi:hypothetical protein
MPPAFPIGSVADIARSGPNVRVGSRAPFERRPLLVRCTPELRTKSLRKQTYWLVVPVAASGSWLSSAASGATLASLSFAAAGIEPASGEPWFTGRPSPPTIVDGVELAVGANQRGHKGRQSQAPKQVLGVVTLHAICEE